MYFTLPFKSLGSVSFLRFSILKQINTFIQQGCIKLIKRDSKFLFPIKIECSSKNPEKKITVSLKIVSSTTIFKIDHNNKCFLSTKISILE